MCNSRAEGWLIVLLLAGVPATVDGQDSVDLSGRVLDEQTQDPISGTNVEVIDWRDAVVARTLTNDAGEFRVVLPRPGEYRFRAARIGYRPATTPTLHTDEVVSVEVIIRLDPDAVLLAPLEVTAWARRVQPSPVLEGFRRRLRSGLGHYFTREDIEARKPALVTDILAQVPGVQLRASGRGLHRQIYFGRPPERCPAQIYVDGFLLNGRSRGAGDPSFTLDQAVTPSTVEGIELYPGLSTVPAEFINPDSRCGTVVVWTRRGG